MRITEWKPGGWDLWEIEEELQPDGGLTFRKKSSDNKYVFKKGNGFPAEVPSKVREAVRSIWHRLQQNLPDDMLLFEGRIRKMDFPDLDYLGRPFVQLDSGHRVFGFFDDVDETEDLPREARECLQKFWLKGFPLSEDMCLVKSSAGKAAIAKMRAGKVRGPDGMSMACPKEGTEEFESLDVQQKARARMLRPGVRGATPSISVARTVFKDEFTLGEFGVMWKHKGQWLPVENLPFPPETRDTIKAAARQWLKKFKITITVKE